MILELCCLCCPALLSMPRPVGADGAALHHLFVPTKNVTDSHWTSKRLQKKDSVVFSNAKESSVVFSAFLVAFENVTTNRRISYFFLHF